MKNQFDESFYFVIIVDLPTAERKSREIPHTPSLVFPTGKILQNYTQFHNKEINTETVKRYPQYPVGCF